MWSSGFWEPQSSHYGQSPEWHNQMRSEYPYEYPTVWETPSGRLYGLPTETPAPQRYGEHTRYNTPQTSRTPQITRTQTVSQPYEPQYPIYGMNNDDEEMALHLEVGCSAPPPTQWPSRTNSKGQENSQTMSNAPLATQLNALDQIRREKQTARGRDGDPVDKTDDLLAQGYEGLLRKVKEMTPPYTSPGIFVSFQDLCYYAKTYESSNVIATNASLFLNLLSFWKKHNTVEKYILKNMTGSFRQGTSTLVLGPPRSGKSSLMKALAGRLFTSNVCILRGNIEFAGRDLHSKPQPKDEVKLHQIVGYVPQLDIHIPTLTVRETIQFSHALTSKGREKHIQEEPFSDEEMKVLMSMDSLSAEVVMSMLGIRHVGDTVCGNERLRGVSGGQRKRLTSGEVLVGRYPVLLADEISTGLDSATTFDISTSFKAAAHVLNHTVVVSLLQPTPETYNCFDEVLVLSDGHIVYQGPREQVLDYFAALGLPCPPGREAAEFLQEVTLPRGIQKYARKGVEVPTTPEQFAEAWYRSEVFQRRREEDAYFQHNSVQELNALPTEGYTAHKLTSHYSAPFFSRLWWCLKRETKLTMRNMEMLRGLVLQTFVIGFLLGSLFFQIEERDSNGKFAVIFFSLLFLALTGLSQIPGVLAVRPVLYRQMNAGYYDTLSYCIAVSIVDAALIIIQCTVFVIIVYFMCGFTYTFSNWICFLVMCCLGKLSMNAFFKFVGAFAPTPVMGQGMAALVILMFSIYAGYMVPLGDQKPWWVWIYWIDPLQYGMTSLSQLEFLQSARYAVPWNATDPNSLTVGQVFMNQKGIPIETIRYSTGYIFVSGFYVLMLAAFALALRFVRWGERYSRPPPEPDMLNIPTPGEIPFTPCTLAWKTVTYDVDIPGKKGKDAKLGLRLLNEVSGYARPNTMTALMGTSGAGKTTLLDVLAGRKNTGKIGGDILLNGQTCDPITFSRFSGYVEQMDIHSPQQTVAEALRFSAMLRLPRDVSNEDKEAYVWQVIQMLDLTSLANTLIGTKEEGLSVEQAKRVTIGVELAANPAILFLDEPTSGLDSMAADVVMEAIKAVSRTGRTIICTIHQPSTSLFNMFDSLLLMIRGGRTVFFGEIGDNSEALVRYFNSLQDKMPHDGKQNPATWMLYVLGIEGMDFPELYKSSPLCIENNTTLETALQRTGEELKSGHRYQASVATQFNWLLKKWMLTHWRSPQYNVARMLLCIVIGLLVGSTFWQVDLTTENGVFAMIASQFVSFVFVGVIFINTIQPMVETERTVFYREKAANMYHPYLLNIVAGLCEVPYTTVNTFIFTNVFYWMVGLQADAGKFFFWYLVFWLYIMFSVFFGFLLGVLLPNAEVATGASSAFAAVCSLLCGFMQPKLMIGWWWRWLYYGFPLTYAFNCFSASQAYCEQAAIDPRHPGDCPVFTMTNSTTGQPMQVPVWTFVEHYWSLSYEDRWMYVGLLFMFVGLCRVGSGLALSFVNHDKR